MLSDEDARYGVAYNVLYERLAPTYCVNQEHLSHLRSELGKIMSWANNQIPEVRVAYQRASPEIEQCAVSVVDNNERAAKLLGVKKTFPVPP